MTEYIVTKLAVVVKGYLFSFDKKFNIFSLSSGNYDYSIIGGKVQGGETSIEYRVYSIVLRKEKEKKEKRTEKKLVSSIAYMV